MPILAIDIGNTYAHLGLVENRKVIRRCDVDTRLVAMASPEAVEIVKKYAARAEGVSFASVVPVATGGLNAILRRLNLSEKAFNLRCDTLRGLEIAYPHPQEIGQDRLANSVAAQELCGLPVVAISMGTATVFDILTKEGYAGGMIAPGLAALTDYLHEKTAQLPQIAPTDLETSSAIGRTTVDAMKNGVRYGYVGMLKEMLGATLAELDKMGEGGASILTTGGGANVLPTDAVPGARRVPDLGLIGLEIAWRRAR